MNKVLNKVEIAARVGAAQYDLANGREQLEVEKDLIQLRKDIVAGIDGGDAGVLACYREDAVAQYARLRELICEMDMQTAPDLELFHLSACAELARQKMEFYFDVRNRMAAGRVREGASCQG